MGDIKGRDGYKKEQQEQKKKFLEQEKKQEVTVKDKETTAQAAKELKQEGTKEGAAAARKGMEQAGKGVDRKIDEQKREHDGMSRKAEGVEKEVKRSSDASRTDTRTADRAAGSVKTEAGREGLKTAAKAADEDSKWLEDLRKNRELERKDSEKKTKEQFDKVIRTKVQTKR